MKANGRPPLGRSPLRLRGRRVLQPSNTNTPLRTPSAAMTKPLMKKSQFKPEYQTSSFDDLMYFPKNVQDGVGENVGSGFEKGRFYDEYIAMRDERLRKRQIENEVIVEPKTAYNLGVKAESTVVKKKEFKKKAESVKKSAVAVAVECSVDRSQHPRYSLRSTVKKPPLPVPMNVDENMTARKSYVTSRSRRK